MTFEQAIRSGFDNYATFDGRANRPAYWWWVLFAVLVGIAAQIIGQIIGTQVIYYLAAIALFLPGLAVGVRRLHDTNRSGWWILIALIPIIGVIVLIIFLVQESDPGPNQYGPPMEAPEPTPTGPAAG